MQYGPEILFIRLVMMQKNAMIMKQGTITMNQVAIMMNQDAFSMLVPES